MHKDNLETAGLKQKITHQLEELAEIFVYLAFCFCAVATYRMLLLNQFHLSYFDYGAALVNALVIAQSYSAGRRRAPW